MTFNVLGLLKLNHSLAKAVLKQVLAIDAALIDGVYFETSPGRGSDDYIGDHTALDALIAYRESDGETGFVGIEVKYAEAPTSTATPAKPRLLELASKSGLFKDASAPELQQSSLRQFFAEHVLCYSMVHEQRLFDRGRFIVIAPTMNHEIQSALEAYQAHLDPAHRGLLPFKVVSLEAVVAAICDAGELELARLLDERYLDFGPVYDLIDDWIPHVTMGNAAPG